jgi:hypothetical protein
MSSAPINGRRRPRRSLNPPRREGSTDFFIAWQAEWFHAYILLDFYVFDNGKVLSIQACSA